MHTRDIAESFYSVISAITTGSLEDLDAYIRYDVIDHNVILGQGDGLPGLKYWAKTMREIFPDLTATIADSFSDGSKVAARVTWTGTHCGEHLGISATDRFLSIDSFYILHFEDGLVVEWWDGSDAIQELHHIYAAMTLPALAQKPWVIN